MDCAICRQPLGTEPTMALGSGMQVCHRRCVESRQGEANGGKPFRETVTLDDRDVGRIKESELRD